MTLRFFTLISLAWITAAHGGEIFYCANGKGERYAANQPCMAGYSQEKEPQTETLPSSAEPVTLPLVPTRRREQYWLDATLNDQVLVRFLLDAQSDMLLIPEDVVEALNEKEPIQDSDKLGMVPVTQVDGSILELPTLRLHTLTLGATKLDNQIAIVGTKGMAPVLGLSVLARVGNWRIDREHNHLVLDKGAEKNGHAIGGSASPQEGASQCVTMNSKVLNNQKTLDDITAEQKTANEKIIDFFDALKKKERELKEFQKKLDLQSNAAVKEWNDLVAALIREQKNAEQLREKHEKETAARKVQFESLLADAKVFAILFNKKCAGTLYKQGDGWQTFPVYTVH